MESKEGKEKQFLRVKVAKKISIPSFVHTPLIHSFTHSLSFFLPFLISVFVANIF